MDEIDSRLTEVFRTTFADESIELSPGTTADDIPAWDSITHIQLIFAVEEEFGIKLTMQDLESLDDVGALQAAIARHQQRSAAG